MGWNLAVYVAPLFVSAAVAVAFVLYAARRRSAPGAIPFAVLMLALGQWSAGYALELASSDLAARLFWVRFQYLGIAATPLAWLLLALQYTGRAIWLEPRRIVSLSLMPALTVVLAWTDAYHGLIWSDYQLRHDGALPTLVPTYGLWFWIHTAYSYALLLIGTALLVQTLLHTLRPYQGQVLVLLGGVVVPWIGNMLTIFDLHPFTHLDLTPFAFIISGPALAWGLFRYRLLDIVPIAQTAVIENMRDPVIVLDAQDRVVDMNLAARELLGYSDNGVAGRPARELFAGFPKLRRCLNASLEEPQQVVITLDQGNARRYIELRVSPLYDRGGRLTGRLMVGRDIADRRRAHEAQQRRAKEQAALYATTLEITASRDLSTLLRSIVEHAVQLLNSDAGALYLCDPERKEVRCVVSYNASRDLTDLVIAYGHGAAGMVAETGQPLIIDDYSTWPGRSALFDSDQPLHAILSVPMIWQEQVLGVILIKHEDRHRHFTESEMELLNLFANQAAIAVENARLLESVQRRAQEAETLRQAGMAVAATLDQDEAIERILVQMERVVPYDSASVQLLRGDYMEIIACRGFANPDEVVGMTFPLTGEVPDKEILATKKPLVVPDTYATYPRFKRNPFGQIRSWLAAPLVYQGEAIGMITLDSGQPNYFTHAHAELLAAFADQVAIAVEHSHLFAAEQQRARELNALHEATAALLSTIDLEVLLSQILRAAVNAIPAAEKGFLLLSDGRAQQLQVRAVHGYSDPRVQELTFGDNTDQISAVAAVRINSPLLINDVRADNALRYEGNIEEVAAVMSTIVTPLHDGGHVLGALCLDATRRDAFTKADLRLLETFAATATAAIRNAQLHAAVQELAVTDPLTGFYNRRGFFDLAQQEIQRALQEKLPLSVLMLDLDSFKRINDTYGHLVGDQVLIGVAVSCQEELQDLGIWGRYGGEEFIALLPETELGSAHQMANRLHRRIVESSMETDRGLVQITVSIGVAVLGDECDDLDALLECTDQALIAAKRAGRNQVMSRPIG